MTINTQLPTADAGRIDRGVVPLEPKRVRLSRAKGWRMPENTVSVARPGRWGNRFRIGDTAEVWGDPGVVRFVPITDNAKAVEMFEQWLLLHLEQHPKIMRPALDELRGKNLACWCKPGDACHADVLLRLANHERHNDGVEPHLAAGKDLP